jgi:DNA-binding MarR family transcriptional regulator
MATEANDLIHQPLRLRLMATLNALPARQQLEFTQLRSLLDASDGNLGAHLATLEKAGYISVEKDFVQRKPRTRVALTRTGRQAFEQHVAYLRAILDTATP